MSYLVLALGGFLALAGGAVIHASYPVIEVERGWAGVIAGTVALASGIVTIALGLILHRLAHFQALLSSGRSLPRAQQGAAFRVAHSPPLFSKSPDLADAPAGSPPIAPSLVMRSWPQRHARPSHAAARKIVKPVPAASASMAHEVPAETGAMDDAETAFPAPGFGRAMPPGPEGEAGAGVAQLDFALAEDEQACRESSSPSLGQSPLVAPIAAGETFVQLSSPGISCPDERALPEAAAPEALQNGAAGPTQVWAGETWPGLRSEGVPQAAPVLAGDAMPHLAESALESELTSGDAIARDTLAIVGRHDSEGTSYVMYADGSIEARTDHAVFHFKSMAELKSFMESQAQHPKE